MAKKNLFTGELKKNEDWSGPIVRTIEGEEVVYDAAAGEAVQNFIKGSLNQKWGFIYNNNKGLYYIFADEESCNIYLEEERAAQEEQRPMRPEIIALKLSEMNSYSNYRISVELNSEKTLPTNAILLGQKNNEIEFNVSTFDKEDVRFNEAVNINYTITRPDGSTTLLTHIVSTLEGDNTDNLVVDNYIVEGQNVITINIIGTSSNAVANLTIIYQVINLQISDNYDISSVHDISNGKTSSLSITWSVIGSSSSSKYIDWYIDGVQQISPDPIPDGQTSAMRTKSFTIDTASFTEGKHNLQYRAWLSINDKKFYTPTYYKDFIVYNGTTKPIIAVSMELPIGYEPFDETTINTPQAYGMVQYTNYELPIAVYKPNTQSVDMNVSVEYWNAGVIETDVTYTNSLSTGQIWKASLTPTVSGATIIKIVGGDESNQTIYTIDAEIDKLDLNIHEETAGLILNLRANGKDNSDIGHREEWISHVGSEIHTTTFRGFTWDENSGWNNDELVISNGNSIEIDLKPLTAAVKDNGLTFEIEFSTFNVSNDDGVICKIKDEGDNTPGIEITASEAKFCDNAKNIVSTKFKSGENNRIVFVVDPTTQGKPLMYIYVNGAACGASSYQRETSSFAANKYIKIEGTKDAEIKLRHIRIYNTCLQSDAILNNYILYRKTYEEMRQLYLRNEVYSSSGVFDLNAISETVPIMLFTDSDIDPERNNIMNLMSFTKVDKSTPILLKQLIYINNLDPLTSFVVDYPQVTCQGTSSMNYPKKNLRPYIKDKAKGKYGEWPLPVLHTGSTENPISLKNLEGSWTSKPGKGKMAFKSCLPGTSSEGERIPQAVNCWTLKADFAESSSSHNTGVARLWNQVMRDAAIDGTFVSRTRAQAVTMSDSENRMDVRTTVDGFPIVCFYRTSVDDNNWKFLGKYNFNNDKSTESVFGFCDIEGINYQKYEYEVSNEVDFENASVDEKQENTVNYSNVSDYEKALLDKTGKKSIEELEEIDYVKALSPTVYEYSKPFQKTNVTIANVPYGNPYYGHKLMISGDTNTKNYCVEVLENENTLTNFIGDLNDFDKNWEDAFEFRYPEVDADIPDADTKGGLTNLREFYSWCRSTRHEASEFNPEMEHVVTIKGETKRDGDPLYKQNPESGMTYINDGIYNASTFEEFDMLQERKFQKEKWDYLDVFKMAAYYIYFMRFGGVDQVVKNSMFTTEGTVSYVYNHNATDKKLVESIGNHCKWFYINYDNDTILGLNNDGQLVYGPMIDRNTRTGSGQWIEHDEPTQEMIDKCRPEKFDSIDDLKHAIEIGAITVESGDMFLIVGTVYEWSNESGYAYAGHSSTLWNNLEKDEEFMTIVSAMDNALYQAGLTYENTIHMFNEKQANLWCERILNQDAQWKYIDSYTRENLNHLGKMQGPRTSHRSWWLNKRFTYFDSKLISGEYKNKFVMFKADAPIGSTDLNFTVKPTELMNYGWGITGRANGQTGIPSKKDERGEYLPLTFDVADGGMSALAPGDPVEIYATPYISELDLSNFASYLMVLDLKGVANDVLGSQLKRLILGKPGKINSGENALKQSDLTELAKADRLEYIDMQGFKELTNLNLTDNPNVKEVYAFRSGLLALTIPNGSKMEKISLPSCYNTLVLDGVNSLTANNIIFEEDIENPMSNITRLEIKNCDKLKESSFNILKKWYDQRATKGYSNTVVVMDNFNWTIQYNDLDIIETLKHEGCDITLSGKITISDRVQGDTRDESIRRVTRIKNMFGDNCFIESEKPEVFVNISIPFVIINSNVEEIVAKIGEKIDFSCEIYPSREKNSTITYSISSENPRTGVNIITNIEEGTGVLTADELIVGSTSVLTIKVEYKIYGGNSFVSEKTVKIYDPTYPTRVMINGITSLYKDNTYYYNVLDYIGASGRTESTGTCNYEWELVPDEPQYIAESGVTGTPKEFYLKTSIDEPESVSKMYLTVKVTPYIGEQVSVTLELLYLNGDVILTKESNPVAMKVFYEAGLTSGKEDVMLSSDASLVTNEDFGTIFSGVTSAFTFTTELEYFTLLTELAPAAFKDATGLKAITLPDRITVLGEECFSGCKNLENVIFGEGIEVLPEYCFLDCLNLMELDLPNSLKRIENYSLGSIGVTKAVLKNETDIDNAIILPDGLNFIGDYAFERNENSWSSVTAYNKLTVLSLPRDFTGFTTEASVVLRGRYIQKFVVDENNTQYSTSDGVLYNKLFQTLYKYPCGKLGTTYKIENSCLSLCDYAFYDSKFENIRLTENIISMGTYVFGNCKYLISVDFSGAPGVTFIPTRTFTDCSLLTDIIWGDYIKTIDRYAIAKCNSLISLTLPDTIREMGWYAIFENSNLLEVVLPKYLKLTNYIVSGNNKLEKITLPVFSENGEVYNETYPVLLVQNSSNISEFIMREEDDGTHVAIEDGVVYGIIDDVIRTLIKSPSTKTSVIIPATVTELGANSFADTNITNITLPEGLLTIGGSAFNNAKKLQTITIPSTVKSLAGVSTFLGATGLTEFIENSRVITEVGGLFFQNCRNLYKLTFATNTVPQAKENSFTSLGVDVDVTKHPKEIYVLEHLIDSYKSNIVWKQLEEMGYTFKPFMIPTRNIYVKISNIEESKTPFIGEIPGVLVTSGLYEGYYEFMMPDVADSSTLYIANEETGTNIAKFNVYIETVVYESEPLLSKTSKTPMLMAMDNANNINEGGISKMEYALLKAKIAQLECIIKRLQQ